MKNSERDVKVVLGIILVTIALLGVHFVTLYSSRTQLIENSRAINQLRHVQGNIQRVAKNEMFFMPSASLIAIIDAELTEVTGMIHKDYKKNGLLTTQVDSLLEEWHEFSLMLEAYRYEPNIELRNQIHVFSDQLWHQSDKVILNIQSEMDHDLNRYWTMLGVLMLVILMVLITFIFVWRTVKNSLVGMALRDPLTGCFNRNYFDEYYEVQMNLYERYQHGFSIAMLDLDHFKQINDTHGHDAGDRVLKQFSRLVQSCIRGSDILVRYGGEEFLILFPNTHEKEAYVIAEKIRKEIENYKGFECGVLTVSIGIADIEKRENKGQNVLKNADIALYYSKSHGRNQTHIFNG